MNFRSFLPGPKLFNHTIPDVKEYHNADEAIERIKEIYNKSV